MMPSISIIIPTRNQERFLPEAIDSVLRQNYPGIEIFVADGKSEDQTVSILKRYDQRIRWISEPDRGQSDAINKGIRNTKGEILGWLNSDDCYCEGALAAVGDFFAAHPEVMWAAGPCRIIDEQGKEVRKGITAYKNIRLKRYGYRSLLTENYISQMGVFFRRKAVEQAGLLDLSLHYAMDYDLWLRLGKRFQPGILNQYLGQFRVYPSTKSSTGFHRQFREQVEVAKRYAGKNPWILFWQRFNCFKIVLAYECLRFFRRQA